MSPTSASEPVIAAMRRSRRTPRDGSRTPTHLRLEAFPHCRERITTGAQSSKPARSHFEVALRSSATLRRRLAEPRRHIAFRLEPIERAIECTDRQPAARPPVDLKTNRNPIRIVAQSNDGQEHDLFE